MTYVDFIRALIAIYLYVLWYDIRYTIEYIHFPAYCIKTYGEGVPQLTICTLCLLTHEELIQCRVVIRVSLKRVLVTDACECTKQSHVNNLINDIIDMQYVCRCA